MIYPSVDELEKQVDAKYTLVIAAAKRARQLREGSPNLVEVSSSKEVSIALHEIAQGKVSYERTKDGIK